MMAPTVPCSDPMQSTGVSPRCAHMLQRSRFVRYAEVEHTNFIAHLTHCDPIGQQPGVCREQQTPGRPLNASLQLPAKQQSVHPCVRRSSRPCPVIGSGAGEVSS